MSVNLVDVRAASGVIEGICLRTPMISAATFSEWCGFPIALKAENLQRTGSFKLRGGTNRIANMTADERSRGVVAASAGNHAQGIALAARSAGVAARVYMPLGSSIAKQQAAIGYGAEVVLAGETFDDAQRAATSDPDGRVFVSAFDDRHIIAGQGTLGLEVLEDAPDLDTIVVPLGGGGLLGGIAVAVKALRPDVRVVGVQAAGCASYLASLAAGAPVAAPFATTIADGIAVKRPGDLTFPLVQRFVDEIVEVDEAEICRAITALLERSKLLVEGGGAAGLAALLSGRVRGGNVVCVLSGGNLDAGLLQSIVRFGLDASGRFLKLRTTMPDRPGSLSRVLAVLAEGRINVLDVEHHREALHLGVSDVSCLITVETRGDDHADDVLELVRQAGYPAERV